MDGLDRQRQRNARRWRERIARFRTQGAASLGLCLLAALAAGALVLALAAALGAGPGDGGGGVAGVAGGGGGGGAIISTESGVTIGLVLAVVGSVVSMTVWITSRLNSLSRKIDSSMERVSRLEMEYLSIDKAAENALRHAIENPGHRVPDPRRPGKVLVVRHGGGEPDDGGEG